MRDINMLPVPANYRWIGGKVADNFAGGGGASTGIAQALGQSPDIAVNHNAEALMMHEQNHPETKHYNESVWDINIPMATEGQPVLMGWFSPDCFPAGTLVLTSEGYQAIDNVGVGQLVWTHNNRWKKVTKVMTAVKPLLQIRGYGHPGLQVSSEHPFYIRRGKQAAVSEWVTAGQLTRSDYWATPADFSASNLSIPQVGGRGMDISHELLWLAGYYAGNGWSRLGNDRAELVLTTHKDKADALLHHLEQWTPPKYTNGRGTRCGYNQLAWNRRNTRTATQLSTNHKGLVEWLRDNVGHLAENKTVPAWLLGLDETCRQRFLDGYMEADGHFRDGLWMADSVGKKLIFGIKALASSLGKSVLVYKAKPRAVNQIEGRDITCQPIWSVRWRDQVDPAHQQSWRDEGMEWGAVKEVTELAEPVRVFNLSVEDDESYVVEGIVVHNCTHFSVAKGGKPVKKVIRGLAWIVKKWAGQSDMAMLFMENVREFTTWGPLIAKRCKVTKRVIKLVADAKKKDKNGDPVMNEVVSEPGEYVPYRHQALVPDKKRAGKTFKQFIRQLRAAGYEVEWRDKGLNACDYGDPTTRNRFFLMARKDGLPIIWPEPTHGNKKQVNANAALKPWKTAGENLDFSIACPSIFDRKKPLAEKTLARIFKGIEKFVVGAGDEAFLVKTNHAYDQFRGQSLDDPLQTITSKLGTGLAAMSLIPTGYGEREGQAPRTHDLQHPLPTLVSTNKFAAVEAKLEPLMQLGCITTIDHGGARTAPLQGLDAPLGVITSKARHIQVAALLKHYTGVVGQTLDKPLPTITATDHNAVLEVTATHIQRDFGNSVGHSADEPLGAIMPGGGGKSAVIASSLVKLKGTCNHGQSLDRPLDAIAAQGNHFGAVQAFMIKYYGTGGAVSVDEPLDAITSKARFGLVTIKGQDYQIVDIGMRMLEPHELYRCQGFPDNYEHEVVMGKKLPKHAQVRMVGNSVPPGLARALVSANIPRWALRCEMAESA